jgi:UPF0716 protein FxsA
MLALILFILWPIAEIYVAVKVADAIGVIAMILLLIAGWPLGTWALRSRGRAAWRRLAAAVAEGRPPGREVIDGALIVIGGVLLLVPGFITDIVALFVLFPPTRSLARRGLHRNLQSRVVVNAVRFTRRGQTYDVDSTAADVDQPRLRP